MSPPSAALQPDSGFLEAIQDVVETYRRSEVAPGMQKYLAAAGANSGPPRSEPEPQGKPSPEGLQAMAQMLKNAEFFLQHLILAISAYAPDVGALKAGSTRIVAAVGKASRRQVAHQGGLEVARRLGAEAAKFPGGHGGSMTHRVEFARKLSTSRNEGGGGLPAGSHQTACPEAPGEQPPRVCAARLQSTAVGKMDSFFW
jgi:uncharacterized protein (DUF362 family)